MTVLDTKPARPRTDVVTSHTYAIPVVRELPRPAADLMNDLTW